MRQSSESYSRFDEIRRRRVRAERVLERGDRDRRARVDELRCEAAAPRCRSRTTEPHFEPKETSIERTLRRRLVAPV